MTTITTVTDQQPMSHIGDQMTEAQTMLAMSTINDTIDKTGTADAETFTKAIEQAKSELVQTEEDIGGTPF